MELLSQNTVVAAVLRGAVVSDICLICGDLLCYLDIAEEMVCVVCGRTFVGNSCCKNGHYICDECHAAPAEAAVRTVAKNTVSKNPIEIATDMMNSPSVHMHGPEHHFLVAAALLAAYKNLGSEFDLESSLQTIISRGKMVPGGSCGMAGNCGAAVSAGIFFSTVQKTTPLSKEQWVQGMRITASCLLAVAEHGGPRCCKRDSFAALTAAAAFVKEELGIVFEMPEKICCPFSQQNRECLKEECPYHS